jgi:putative colanic acid biosynthesis acetyltransferase WcaF
LVKGVWLAAASFIAPGVEVGSGAIVSAGSVVFASVAPKTFVRGNPATGVSKTRKHKTKEEKLATPNQSRAVEKFCDI